MTAAPREQSIRKVKALPFILALTIVPLATGAPAFAMATLSQSLTRYPGEIHIIPAFLGFAAFIGTPTYLLFGGPAFWVALKTNSSVIGMGFLGNFVSLPFVFVFIELQGGNGIAFMPLFLIFGSVFSAIWSVLFAGLYRLFSGGRAHV